MVLAPIDGRVLLPREALVERLWQAYAYALNTDEERHSLRGFGLFPDELRVLHTSVCRGMRGDQRQATIAVAAAFAERWQLRRRDIWATCHVMEMHGSDEPPRPGSLVLQMPLVVYSAPEGLEPVEVVPALVYDPTQMTGVQVRAEVEARFRSAHEAVADAERGWIAGGYMARISARHANREQLFALARRYLRRTKGWTMRELADFEGINETSIRSFLRTWSILERDRRSADQGFTTPD